MTIDDIQEKIKQEYQGKMYYSFQLHVVNTEIIIRSDKKKTEYCLYNLRSKNVKRILKAYLSEKGHRVFYQLFGIESKTIEFPVEFDGVLLSKDTYSPHNYELLYCERLKLLSSVEYSQMHIMVEGEDLVSACNFNYDIISENNFKGSIFVKYNFNYVEEIAPWTLIEYSERYLECELYALYKEENVELWQEYILNSFVFYEAGNARMAFFNAFAALDQCIEIMYQCLYETISHMSKYIVCCDVDENAKKYLIKSLDKYKKKERRLVDEKLKDCLKVLFPEGNYSDLLKKLKEFEKTRNNIAHCTDDEGEEQYLDLMWAILELLSKVHGTEIKEMFVFLDE